MNPPYNNVLEQPTAGYLAVDAPGSGFFESLSVAKGRKAALTLDDGTVFEGLSVGKASEAEGEVIFITAMSGYQEVLTDPSYHGQIVVFTTAHVGNYGTNPRVDQAAAVQAAGAIFHELWQPGVTHWLNEKTLPDYMDFNGLGCLTGVDTRALTLHIRTYGARNGWIGPMIDPEAAKARALKVIPMTGRDLALEVTCQARYQLEARPLPEVTGRPMKVAVLDFGIKNAILDNLRAQNLNLTVWPANTGADDFMAEKPEGLFLANGPGDPEACDYAVKAVKATLGKIPIFGICLGHQIMGLAAGGRTYKLPFGHHGLNHPVKDSKTGRIWLTSQNHGFCVDPDSLPANVTPTHMNLNDDTLEGLEWRDLPAFSVQFHPEASPGPHDAHGLFKRFRALLEAFHA
ncbi:MAG: glutamine-hydrolyzing carbamoyl-phosphate synthase small subunit [Deltaproteobacteria bacterium]|jgi:carbamoyl-phosphate synthase small subunit|nr:glutamine-hydrolyzing carbamoyl-phosphate synthase small subunit [Deltaproteobacteria bacterium]